MRTQPLYVVAAGVLVLVVAGIVFEQIGERGDRRRYEQVGVR